MPQVNEKNKNVYFIFLLILLTLPLFFVNVRSDQSWGDDFAGYLNQANNILNGKPQYETGYIYNERYEMLGPKAYTNGFPLLIVPIVAIFGIDMLALNYYMTFFLAVTFILMIVYLKKFIKPWQAICVGLIFIYNPWVLRFKSEIFSEITFTAFMLLFILIHLYKEKKLFLLIIQCLVGGFLISIRPIGAVVVIAVAINTLINWFCASEKRKSVLLQEIILIPLFSILVFVVLNYLIVPVSPGFNSGNQLRSNLFLLDSDLISKNAGIYSELIKNFISSDEKNSWWFISVFGGSFLLITAALGFIHKIKRGIGISELTVLLYLIVLLVYSYSDAGFRFLLPIAPFILMYSGLGIVAQASIYNWKSSTGILFLLTIFLSYNHEWIKIKDEENSIQAGPYEYDAQNMFDYIKEHTNKDEIFLFKKPRALSLYTGRNAFTNFPYESADVFKEQIQKLNIDYLITSDENPNPALNTFLSSDSSWVKEVYNSGSMKLFKMLK
jgi:hypothetical protein